MRKDIEHFADAERARGLDSSSVRNRGLGGADGVLAPAGSRKRTRVGRGNRRRYLGEAARKSTGLRRDTFSGDIRCGTCRLRRLGRTSPDLLKKIRPVLLHNPAQDLESGRQEVAGDSV